MHYFCRILRKEASSAQSPLAPSTRRQTPFRPRGKQWLGHQDLFLSGRAPSGLPDRRFSESAPTTDELLRVDQTLHRWWPGPALCCSKNRPPSSAARVRGAELGASSSQRYLRSSPIRDFSSSV